MTKFKTVITTVGAAKIAAVLAGTGSIVLDGNARMAVGDGNGTLPTPVPSQTALVHEVHRAALNSASIDARDPKNIIAELVIPPGIGGFWTREMALYDAAGTLLAVGNMAEAYKPSLSEGAGRQQVIRMVIAVSDVSAVTISIDSSTVMATKEYVDESIDKHEKSRKHPDATLTEKGFTQLNSATDSASETQAATPKAVKTVMDATNLKAPLNSPTLTGIPLAPTAPPGTNNQQLANTAFVRAAITALINASPGLLDTLGELAAALGNDANFATTMANALAGKQPLDTTLSNLSGKTVAGLLLYLGLKSAALKDVGTVAGTVAAGDDSRIVNALQRDSALYAGFETGLVDAPYMRHDPSNEIVRLATRDYVGNAIAALVASSPAALDTLNELAAALGNDPHFATTMLNALSGKQPLDTTLNSLSGKNTAQLREFLGLVIGSNAGNVVTSGSTQPFYKSEIPAGMTATRSKNGYLSQTNIAPDSVAKFAALNAISSAGFWDVEFAAGAYCPPGSSIHQAGFSLSCTDGTGYTRTWLLKNDGTLTGPAGDMASVNFVQNAIAALVASSPAALDTLNELAAALGNDPHFATTMLNALAGKQPLDTTLNSLSGKNAAQLREFLGLVIGSSAGNVVTSGSTQPVYKSQVQPAMWGELTKGGYVADANMAPDSVAKLATLIAHSVGWNVEFSMGAYCSPDGSVNQSGISLSATDGNGYSRRWVFLNDGTLTGPEGDFASQKWVSDHFLVLDGATIAGFAANNIAQPYMRHKESNTPVVLATADQLEAKSVNDRTWAGNQFAKKDGVTYVGFSGGSASVPYMRHEATTEVVALQLQNSAFIRESGWSRDGSTGLITQWGTRAGVSDDTPTGVNFPTAFPNACLGFYPVLKRDSKTSNATTMLSVWGVANNNSSATVFFQSNGQEADARAGDITWMAIGY